MTFLVTCRVEGLVLVTEVEILQFELVELLSALLQLLGMLVELLLQALKLQGALGIGLQTIDLPLEFGLSLGSFG